MDQAENLRSIMKNQNQNTTKGNARVFAVTSGKGGVGKSNVSINLALQFEKLGKHVIILDADFGLANIEVMFGVIPQYNLSDIIFKDKSLKEVIAKGPNGVEFISGGSGIAKLVDLSKEDMKNMASRLSELEQMADIVIIDTGAGISASVMEFLVSAPEIILVTTPEPTSITDSYALLKALSMNEDFQKNGTKINIIANKVMSEQEGKILFKKLGIVVTQFLKLDLNLLGIVPQDNCISKSVMKQTPVSLMYPSSKAAKSFETISNEIISGKLPEPTNKKGIAGYLKGIFMKQ